MFIRLNKLLSNIVIVTGKSGCMSTKGTIELNQIMSYLTLFRNFRGHHCSVDSSVRFQVLIPSTPSTLFPFVVKWCTILVIVLIKGGNEKTKKRSSYISQFIMVSGCGSVGRAVASNSRGPRFESSHREQFILNIYCQLYSKKDKNKEKEAGNGPFF